MLADLDQLDRRDLHAEVQEAAAADADPARRRRGQPHARLEQHVLAQLQPALAQQLEHVAVQRPAAERAPAGELGVDARAVPRQRVALVVAPLLRPQLDVRGIHAAGTLSAGRSQGRSARRSKRRAGTRKSARRRQRALQGAVTPRAAVWPEGIAANRADDPSTTGGHAVRRYLVTGLLATLSLRSRSPRRRRPRSPTPSSRARRCGRSPPPTTSRRAPSRPTTASRRTRRSCSARRSACRRPSRATRRCREPGSSPADPAAAAAPAAGGGGYTVQPGDTLSGIAANAGVSVADLAAANGLDPAGIIVAGTHAHARRRRRRPAPPARARRRPPRAPTPCAPATRSPGSPPGPASRWPTWPR